MNRTDFEADARRDGYTINEGQIKPGETRKPHTHDFDARLFVVDGSMTLVRGDESETFGPGEFCSLQAGTLHVEQCGAEGVRYVAARRAQAAG
jgi:mannose-6-phosphate isomerase-like protein (cupin superfamily)